MHVMREDGRAPGQNVMGEFDGTWAVRESLFEKVPLKLRPAGVEKNGQSEGTGLWERGRGSKGEPFRGECAEEERENGNCSSLFSSLNWKVLTTYVVGSINSFKNFFKWCI